MHVAHCLVGGCDVWLNNPRKPLEASGTSGMKASLNGVPHLSVGDGWWAEGFNGQQRLADRKPDQPRRSRRHRCGRRRVAVSAARRADRAGVLRTRRRARPAALGADRPRSDAIESAALLGAPHAEAVRQRDVHAGGALGSTPRCSPASARDQSPRSRALRWYHFFHARGSPRLASFALLGLQPRALGFVIERRATPASSARRRDARNVAVVATIVATCPIVTALVLSMVSRLVW